MEFIISKNHRNLFKFQIPKIQWDLKMKNKRTRKKYLRNLKPNRVQISIIKLIKHFPEVIQENQRNHYTLFQIVIFYDVISSEMLSNILKKLQKEYPTLTFYPKKNKAGKLEGNSKY